MFLSTGRTAAWKAHHVHGEPSSEAARGNMGRHGQLFLYVPRVWDEAVMLFQQTLSSLGQRESSSKDMVAHLQDKSWWLGFWKCPSTIQ